MVGCEAAEGIALVRVAPCNGFAGSCSHQVLALILTTTHGSSHGMLETLHGLAFMLVMTLVCSGLALQQVGIVGQMQ